MATTDQEALSVVTGDFNRDAKLDIAFDNGANDGTIAGCPAQGCVSVLLGNGDGTFSGPHDYPIDGTPAPDGTASLAEGDLTGNGTLDLVVADFTCDGADSGCVSILYGNGDGTFQAPVDITTGVNDPNDVVVGDFTGDGRQDIAVANEADETVSVLLNTGNDAQGHVIWTPAPGSPYPLDPSSNGAIDGMTAANIDGHGNVDLVLSTNPGATLGGAPCGTADCVQVLTRTAATGPGPLFDQAVAYPAAGFGQVAAADLRGTGLDDVLVPANVQNDTTGTGGFEVLLNQANGTLDSPATPSVYTYPTSENPRALVVGDFNNDGKLDVAMADFTSSTTVLFAGNGDGTFNYDDTVADPGHLQGSDNALATADFTGDCKLDLALGTYDGGLFVLRNDTPPAGSICPNSSPPVTPAPPPIPAPAAASSPTPVSIRKPATTPKLHAYLPRVTQRIELARAPLTRCTTQTLRFRVTIALSPRAIANRRTAHGRRLVSVTTVIRLDGRRFRTSTRREFELGVPLAHLSVGSHELAITTSSHGNGVRGTSKTRVIRISRCIPPPSFTG